MAVAVQLSKYVVIRFDPGHISNHKATIIVVLTSRSESGCSDNNFYRKIGSCVRIKQDYHAGDPKWNDFPCAAL